MSSPAARMPWPQWTRLGGLFLIQWMALGIWMVPLSTLLDAHGLQEMRPFAFAASALAALVSPLLFGAMADRHVPPVLVLRRLAMASCALTLLASYAIDHQWPFAAILGVIQCLALCTTPVTSISTSIVFAQLSDPKRQFGPIRAMATFGWMCGCWLVSALNADASTRSCYAGAVTWLGLLAFTYLLPETPPPPSTGKITLRERMGWDALVLLKNKDTLVVFIAAALYNIPLSSFYTSTPPHMRALGLEHTSAWMSLGQVSEIFAMFALAGVLTRWRLKWVFAAGLTFGVLRYALCAFNTKGLLLLGVSLHGLSYTLFYITAQIFLEQRIDPAWRTRAQALFTLMNSGIGNLAGYLGVGVWFKVCTTAGATRWTLFWTGMSLCVAAVMAWFLAAYHGRGGGVLQHPGQSPSAETVDARQA